jgi:UrcA family protein
VIELYLGTLKSVATSKIDFGGNPQAPPSGRHTGSNALKQVMVLALALALSAPAVSHAAGADRTTMTPVRYDDLDLDNAADAAVLLKRIDHAASEACGASAFSLREYRQAVRNSACHEEGMSRAVATVNAPTVTAIYNSRTVLVATSKAEGPRPY